eukprot:8583839-Pyramimonas_sp.AAC.1
MALAGVTTGAGSRQRAGGRKEKAHCATMKVCSCQYPGSTQEPSRPRRLRAMIPTTARALCMEAPPAVPSLAWSSGLLLYKTN